MNALPTEIVASLFTLFGVLITIFVRWASIRHKVRYESLKIYADKLATARLEAYPCLYKILSDAIKRIDFEDAFSSEDKLNLINLEKSINSWDSENGILLTRVSGDLAFALRNLLRKLIDNKETLQSKEIRESLRESLKELEIGLRIDLSIYELEFGIVKHGFGGRPWWSKIFKR